MGRPSVNWSVGIAAEKQSTYTSKAVKAGIPFASQVTESGTKYIIKYDFNLEGESVEMPENCILEFDGGSLSNGTLNGDNTVIDAGLEKIFDPNIEISGTWNIGYAYPEWFGAKGDGITDDTNAFYAALSKFNTIFLQGSYSIDFRDITLNYWTIVGKCRTRSVIIQRNSNIPFAFVKSYNVIKGITFRTYNNTEDTAVLHFGYDGEEYYSFAWSRIVDIHFVGKYSTVGADSSEDTHTIPFLFDLQQGGNSDLIVEDIQVSYCHTGMWFKFQEVDARVYGWITQCVFKDIFIYNPAYYGLRWDALSMSNLDTRTSEITKKTMWCYANYFENIGVDLVRDGSIGFKIGQGMGTVVNPMVFNDLKNGQHGATASSVGYSVEFAPILPPLRPKMVTRVIGGVLEGQIINRDFAYMNDMESMNMTIRNMQSPDMGYTCLNSASLSDCFDISPFGTRAFQMYSTNNVTLTAGTDEVGDYVMATRVDEEAPFYFWLSFSKSALMNAGVENGLYTIQALAQSNLGKSSSGFVLGSSTNKYLYTIDGKGSTATTVDERKSAILNSVYINITDDPIQDENNIQFGYRGNADSGIRWVKLYRVRMVHGLVGNYLMYKPYIADKPAMFHERTYTKAFGELTIDTNFISVPQFLAGNLPSQVIVTGTLTSGSEGDTKTFGAPSYYNLKQALNFNLYNSDDGTLVGICILETDGTLKVKYIVGVSQEISVRGSL